jgi:hypothetical protein
VFSVRIQPFAFRLGESVECIPRRREGGHWSAILPDDLLKGLRSRKGVDVLQ